MWDVALMSAVSLGLPGEKGEKGNPGVGTQGPRGPPGSTGKVVTAGAAGLHCSHPSARHLRILWLCPPLLRLMQQKKLVFRHPAVVRLLLCDVTL